MSDVDYNIPKTVIDEMKHSPLGVPKKPFNMVMVVGGDPSSSCSLVASFLKEKSQLEFVGTLNSKFLYVPSLYFIDPTDFGEANRTLSGEGQFMMDWDSRTLYLIFDRFRPLNPIDSESEWVYLYPIFSSISKFCLENNIGSISALSTSIIHWFAENEELNMLNEGEIYEVDWLKRKTSKNLKGEPFCILPYMHLPRIFSQMTHQKGLSVIAGSIDSPDKLGFKTAHSLMKWLRKTHKLKFTLPQLKNIAKEFEEHYAETPVEAFIKTVEPSFNNGNGVMFQ